MANMITNIMGKSLTGVARLTAYGLGVSAASKLGCLGYRVVYHLASPYTAKDAILEKPAQWAKTLKLNPYANADLTKNKAELLKEAFALSLLAFVIHDATYYIESAPPKIYNTVLSITPVRMINTSIIDAVKETIRTFKVTELFVV